MNKHILKRMSIMVLSAVMMFSYPISVSAANAEASLTEERCMEDILSDYYEQTQFVETRADLKTSSISENTVDLIKSQTITNLRSAGYEAYDVNKDTFGEVVVTHRENF